MESDPELTRLLQAGVLTTFLGVVFVVFPGFMGAWKEHFVAHQMMQDTPRGHMTMRVICVLGGAIMVILGCTLIYKGHFEPMGM